MSFEGINFRSSYNKIDHDIAEEFYLPCMRNSVKYDRISGYFGSSIYIIAWEALREFINNNGKIRIICSPYMREDDAMALSEGNESKKNEIILRSLQEELNKMLNEPTLEKPSRLLACLISNGIIEIKIAIPEELTHPKIKQLFHDKVGVFYDSIGNCVGFRGSLNETFSGLSNCGNIESIDVFQSWDGGREVERVEESKNLFERIWRGETSAKLIRDLPIQLREQIKDIARQGQTWIELLDEVEIDIRKENRETKWLPRGENSILKELRKHQIKSLESWENHERRGILEHATGSGKTITAICAIRDALIRNKVVVVLVPSIGLLEQWETELKKYITDLNVNYLICGSKHARWKRPNTLKNWTTPGINRNVVVLSTMDTAISKPFMNGIVQGPDLLIVVDEVHRIGSESRLAFLKVNAGERLGLSATPIRYGDPLGTKCIMDYFGGVIPPIYSLKNAIDDEVLTKYFYYPTTTSLTSEEQEKWNRITKKINSIYAQILSNSSDTQPVLSSESIDKLLIKRSRIVKNAANKINLALDIVQKNFKQGDKWIVYCDNQKQLSDVLKLFNENHINAFEYHSQMLGDRIETIKFFSQHGGVLVSIRCLDEGIDIPSTTHALILASSKNPREFIQRRGRILRKFEGKHYAYLYDVLVTPNDSTVLDQKGDSIIEAEISRAIQFGQWADNSSCIALLKNIAIDYHIEFNEILKEGVEENE